MKCTIYFQNRCTIIIVTFKNILPTCNEHVHNYYLLKVIIISHTALALFKYLWLIIT